MTSIFDQLANQGALRVDGTADPERLTPDQRLVIEPGTVGHQQFLDGRALDRLRKVLHARADERWRCTVLLSEPDDTNGRVWVTASRLNESKGLDILPAGAASKGFATIAEAADKCREALA